MPFGKRGWFHDAWHRDETWERVRITADMCPRITPEFLDEERRALGDRWYRQESTCAIILSHRIRSRSRMQMDGSDERPKETGSRGELSVVHRFR
jgi:hypothetical protein